MLQRARRFLSAVAKATEARKEIEIFVDGKSVKIAAGSALIQACEKVGATIPRFCYHERLAIAGNCRMCLVEVEKVPKPVASCAYPIMPGMKVFTETPMVHKAREGVMEFLLSNHPLDCPVCDQGGECDLQDQSVRYGSDRGRFKEIMGKRAVSDKDFGPLINTSMNRCIHCTRCVRFANDVAGAEELGTSGRGNHMEISTYIEKTLDSEMSGNIIDLCPVGALTSKPYKFKARPWELKNTETIDVMDGIGSNIRVDSKGVEVLRVLPRVNEAINEEWINDKTRFACDGLSKQRLVSPMLKQDGKFVQVSWKTAFEVIGQKLKQVDGSQITGIAGQHADVESMVALKDLLTRMGSENFRTDVKCVQLAYDFRSTYTFNSTIAGVEQADAVLIIGSNPRHEGSAVNVRLRKKWLAYQNDVAVIGQNVPLTYDYEFIGDDLSALESLDKHAFFKTLKDAQKPLIIVGSSAVEAYGSQVYSKLAKLQSALPNLVTEDWNGINILQRDAAATGAMEIGFAANNQTTALSESKVVYLLNADRIDQEELSHDAFVIYQGHHGDVGANMADIVLPGSAYTEKTTTFVNTEGRSQLTRAAVPAPGVAKNDWAIIRALSEVAGVTLPYDDDYSMKERLIEISPSLIRYNKLESSALMKLALQQFSGSKVPKAKGPLTLPYIDFYLTDVISRNSTTMARCSQAFVKKQNVPEHYGLQEDEVVEITT